jgi:hypothetical protein
VRGRDGDEYCERASTQLIERNCVNLVVEAVEDEDEETLGRREDREQRQEDQLNNALREEDHEETEDP